MKVGNEDKKKLIAAGVLGFCALLAVYPLYQTLFGGTSSPPPPPPVVTTTPGPTVKTIATLNTRSVTSPAGVAVGAKKVATTSGQLDPTLHMEAMLRTESLVYTGTGRNIFAGGPAEVETKLAKVETPKFPARPPAPVLPAVPTGPPPPPAINLKFFGTATTPNGNRRAFLLNGDDVYLASVGDVVQRKYRVVSIAAASILVEDIPNNNKQTLPLVGN